MPEVKAEFVEMSIEESGELGTEAMEIDQILDKSKDEIEILVANDVSGRANDLNIHEAPEPKKKPKRHVDRKNYEESSDDDDIEGFINRVTSGLSKKPTESESPRKSSKESKVKKPPSKPLKYRYIFAVATLDSVVVYSTQRSHVKPIAYLSNLHYAPLTDISWSKDGHFLLLSSTDGFCTIVEFEAEELGIAVDQEQDVVMGTETEASNLPLNHTLIGSDSDATLNAVPITIHVVKDLEKKENVIHVLDSGLVKKRIQPTFIRDL